MYVVTGATGNTGHVVANRLLDQGKKVRVIGRNRERLQPFVARGAEAFVADVKDQAALAKAAADHRYLSLYSQACQRYDDAMQRRRSHADGELIAYFSAEYGLSECLPIYSGGLGILSGDHLKAASELGVPLVGVGLFYRRGYFNQRKIAIR